MKLLLILIVFFLGLWLWRRSREEGRKAAAARPEAVPQVHKESASRPMVQCLHCQLHLPQEEAIQGTLGLYCGTAHLAAAGDRPLPL